MRVTPLDGDALRRDPSLARARAEVVAALDEGEDQGAVEAARSQILRFVDRHPDALWRSCPAGHLTSSALVVDAAIDRFVVLLHTKLGRWLQPGGHADGDGNLAASALREAAEETGIAGLAVTWPAVDLDAHAVSPPGEATHLHLDVRYVVLAPPAARLRGNHESLDLRWVDLDGLDGLDPDAGLRRLVRRGLAAARALR